METAETITQGLEAHVEEADLTISKATPTRALVSQLTLPSWQQILRRTLNKVDLSDWDVETLWEQVPIDSKQVKYFGTQLVDSVTAVLPASGVSDVESTAQKRLETTLTKENDHNNTLSSPDETAIQSIQSKIISFCRYTNTDALTAENLTEKVRSQLEAHHLSVEDVEGVSLDIAEIASVLSRRKKLPAQKQQ